MHTCVHMLGLLMRVGAQAEYSKGLPLPLKYILMWRQRQNMQQQFAQTTAEQVRCWGKKITKTLHAPGQLGCSSAECVHRQPPSGAKLDLQVMLFRHSSYASTSPQIPRNPKPVSR